MSKPSWSSSLTSLQPFVIASTDLKLDLFRQVCDRRHSGALFHYDAGITPLISKDRHRVLQCNKRVRSNIFIRTTAGNKSVSPVPATQSCRLQSATSNFTQTYSLPGVTDLVTNIGPNWDVTRRGLISEPVSTGRGAGPYQASARPKLRRRWALH
jgi:hypothetical protein